VCVCVCVCMCVYVFACMCLCVCVNACMYVRELANAIALCDESSEDSAA
jgi:uncharacterized membrane protein